MSERYGPLKVGYFVKVLFDDSIGRVTDYFTTDDGITKYKVVYVRYPTEQEPVLSYDEGIYEYEDLRPIARQQEFSDAWFRQAPKQKPKQKPKKGGGRGSRKKRTRKKRTRKKRSTMRGGSGVSREWILNWYKQGYPEDEVEGMRLAENVCRECKILKSKYYPGPKVTVVGGDEF